MGKKPRDEDDEAEDALFAAVPVAPKPAAPSPSARVPVPLGVGRYFISAEMEGSAALAGELTCYFAGIHAPEEGVVGTSAWLIGVNDAGGKFVPSRTLRAVFAHGDWSACDRSSAWAAMASLLTYVAEHRKDVTGLAVYGDSELVVNQMRGSWQTNAWNLKKFKERAEAAVVRFHTSNIDMQLYRVPAASNPARAEAEVMFAKYVQQIGQPQLLQQYVAAKAVEAAKPKPSWGGIFGKKASPPPGQPKTLMEVLTSDDFFDDDPLPPAPPKKPKTEVAPRTAASYPPPPPPPAPAFGEPVKRRIVKKLPPPQEGST